MPKEKTLEAAIATALRAALRANVPPPVGSVEWIDDAVARIVAAINKARLEDLASVMGRRRWAGVSAEEHTRITKRAGKKGGRSAWAGMSDAQRSEEMKRRAAVRKENREAAE